jgi:hypothetical protein
MIDDHYFVISADLAAGLADYHRSHPLDVTALRAFVADNNPDADEEYIGTLCESHDFLVSWFGSIDRNSFGVIHITF